MRPLRAEQKSEPVLSKKQKPIYVCMMRSGAERRTKTHIYMTLKGITAEQRTQRTLSELSASADTLLLSLFIQRKPRRNQTAAQSFIYASDRLQGMEINFYKPVAETPTTKTGRRGTETGRRGECWITLDAPMALERSVDVIRLLEKSQRFPNSLPILSQQILLTFCVISAERRIRNAENSS